MIQYEKVNGDFDLSGQAAIMVGGAGGIGEATARMYTRKGARVAIVDCKDNCPEVAAAIKEEKNILPSMQLAFSAYARQWQIR